MSSMGTDVWKNKSFHHTNEWMIHTIFPWPLSLVLYILSVVNKILLKRLQFNFINIYFAINKYNLYILRCERIVFVLVFVFLKRLLFSTFDWWFMYKEIQVNGWPGHHVLLLVSQHLLFRPPWYFFFENPSMIF